MSVKLYLNPAQSGLLSTAPDLTLGSNLRPTLLCAARSNNAKNF